MDTLCAGIMAGGNGTRLPEHVRPHGKAMLSLAGRPLIDHIISHLLEAGVSRLAVVTRAVDVELRQHLEHNVAVPDLTLIDAIEDGGTSSAMRCIVEHFAGEPCYISTCDVVLPPRALVDSGLADAPEGALSIVLTTGYVHDEDPIWVHVDEFGAVTEFGKGRPPSDRVFGHVRWCSGEFAGHLRSLNTGNERRDTNVMRQLARSQPGRVLAVQGGTIIDVDTTDDLAIAERLLLEWA